MKAFRRANLIWLILPLALFFMGCGVADDFEGSANLIVQGHADGNDPENGIVQIPVDGIDEPQSMVWNAILHLENRPRLGVENPPTLKMKKMIVTYRDAHGVRRDAVMPPWTSPGSSGYIEPNGTLELNFVVVNPDHIMYAEGGILDIFMGLPSADQLYPLEDELWAARRWTATVQMEAVEINQNGTTGETITKKYSLDIYFF